MKLNQTMMMAVLMASGVCAASVTARAQDATNAPVTTTNAPATNAPDMARPHGGMMRSNQADFIATRLGLNEDQKARAKPILDDMVQQQLDLRKDASLQMADRRAKIIQIRETTAAKLKDMLTPDQYVRCKQMLGIGTPRPPAMSPAPMPPPGMTPPAPPAPAATSNAAPQQQ